MTQEEGYSTSYLTPDGTQHTLTTFDPKIASRTHSVDRDGTVHTDTRFSLAAQREVMQNGGAVMIGETKSEVPWDVMVERARQFAEKQMNGGNTVLATAQSEVLGSTAETSTRTPEAGKDKALADMLMYFLHKLRETGLDLNKIFDDPAIFELFAKQVAQGLKVDQFGDWYSQIQKQKSVQPIEVNTEQEPTEYSDELIEKPNKDYVLYKRTFKDSHSIFIKQATDGESAKKLKNEGEILRKLDGIKGIPRFITEHPPGFEEGLYSFASTELQGQTMTEVFTQLSREQQRQVIYGIANKIEELVENSIVHQDLYDPDNIYIQVTDNGEIIIGLTDFSNGAIISEPTALAQSLTNSEHGDVTAISKHMQEKWGTEMLSEFNSTNPKQILQLIKSHIQQAYL